jgi:hypothetical protein
MRERGNTVGLEWLAWIVGDSVRPDVEVQNAGEVVGYPTTLAWRRLGPSQDILLINKPWFTCQTVSYIGCCVVGPTTHNLGCPQWGCCERWTWSSWSSPRDQLQHSFPNLHGSRLNSKLKTKFNINSSIDRCIEYGTS